MCEIKNTVKFSFPNGSEKPNMGEIVNFAKSLDADPVQMEAVYRIAEEKSLFIKFKSEDAMLHTLTFNSEDLIFHYANGMEAEVHMSHAGEYIQYVRVYDLPPEVADHQLALVLEKYGKVKRVIREKFPVELCFDMYTGVRGVYMDVKKQIPTSLHFLNRKGNIFYDGNKNKCFLCKTDGHQMNSCPKRKNRKEPDTKHQDERKQQHNGKQTSNIGEQRRNEEQSSTSSYAGVLAGNASSTDNNIKETEEAVEVLEEEVVMGVASPDVALNSGEEASSVTKKPVFKHKNDAYYYNKFGIENYTEEMDKHHAREQQKHLEELALRKRQKAEAEAKLRSPPRKSKKNA